MAFLYRPLLLLILLLLLLSFSFSFPSSFFFLLRLRLRLPYSPPIPLSLLFLCFLPIYLLTFLHATLKARLAKFERDREHEGTWEPRAQHPASDHPYPPDLLVDLSVDRTRSLRPSCRPAVTSAIESDYLRVRPG